jgi:MFS family permease
MNKTWNKTWNRNYFLLFLDKILFINAMAFLSINAVIPYFLNELGASTFLISLATIVASLGILITQPVFSKLAMKLPYKLKTFVKILLVQRFIFLIFVVSIPFIASKSPAVMIAMFLIFWAAFNLFVGSYGPFFMSIMPKLISSEQRGRLTGYGLAVGSFIAMGASVFIGIILKNISYPYNYTVIFSIGLLILFADAFLFRFMVSETPDKTNTEVFGYLQYFKQIPKVMKKNRKFAKTVIGSIFFVVSSISLTYYSLYAIRNFNAGATEIAVFSAITMAVNIAANIILGVVADKFSHNLVLKYSAISGIAAGAIILATNSIFSVYAAFALSSLCACGYQLSCGMLIIEQVPKEELPVYISINSIVSLIMSTTIMLISSLIIDKVSFMPVFAVTFAAGIGAYLVFRGTKGQVQCPRTQGHNRPSK